MLENCVADPEFEHEDRDRQKRIRETLELMTALSRWGDEMLRLEPVTLTKIMKLGSRIQKVVRDPGKK